GGSMQLTLTGALKGELKRDVLRRMMLVGLIAFFTLIDLFAAQALAPQLTEAYGTDTASMGLALNMAAVGMAVAGLTVAWFSDRIDRRLGIWVSLVVLAVPTALLAVVDDLVLFTLLRVIQGACMATAFTLTMTFLSEECDLTAAAGAMAAYVSGNVASNLFGRLMASEVAAGIGVFDTFYVFAALNLLGALLAILVIGVRSTQPPARSGPPLEAWRRHMANPPLRAAFGLGFLILFVFVGVFTYVNFELVGPTYGLAPADLGLVYLVFLPSLITTPMAGDLVARFGPQRLFMGAAALSLAAIAATLPGNLMATLLGLAVLAAATFQMQAAATAFVGRVAEGNRAAANGLYLTAYYLGGLMGALVVGLVYEAGGWTGAALVIALALAGAAALARQLSVPGSATAA
ncbi:MAG: MFS transporter, partial [Pseudomonadota bacterium]